MTPLEHARLAAAANDVEFDQFVVIQETNNVVVWLQPSPVVVKVGRWTHSASGLLLEHAAARYLADSGAPVAKPIGDPYSEPTTSMVSTLWTRIPLAEDPSYGVGPADIAACLATVHTALTDIAIELPDYRVWLGLAAQTLYDDTTMERLDVADRNLLRAAYEQLRPEIDSWASEFRPIHGEPHRGNFMTAAAGLHLIDFETVCRGPIEWDLASLPDDVTRHFDSVDYQLLERLRILNSIRVATWCAIIPAESMRWHLEHHVGVVRSHFGS
jgi:hypothetical protein